MIFSRSEALDLKEPQTWSTDQLKIWLAEHNIDYEGITQKQDLVNLLKSNWTALKESGKSTEEAIADFAKQFEDYMKSTLNEYKDASQERLQILKDQAASRVEDLRRSTGLTEDQMAENLEKVKSSLVTADSKVKGVIEDISQSYATAKSKRDEIAREGTRRIQEDYKKSGDVSQGTIDWLKSKTEELNNSAGFAKSRLRTQYVLILNEVRGQLAATKELSAEQTKSTYDKLLSSLDETYYTVGAKLENLRTELSKTIGILSDRVVSELRSQLSTINDYRLLTQDKILGVIDQFGKKLAEGKDFTVEQIDAIKNSAAEYLGKARDEAEYVGQQTRQVILETKQTQEERFNKLAEYLRESFTKSRDSTTEQMSTVYADLQEKLIATQNLSKEQARIVKETMDEKLGDVKNAKDLSETKVNEFIEALRQRFAESYDSAAKQGESAYAKVKEQIPTRKDEL